ncbi:hypothetical protein WA588_005767 [Blastocystis sp. NMH]
MEAIALNRTVLLDCAVHVVEGFQSLEPFAFLNVADYLCALTSALYLRFRYKSYMRGIPFYFCAFLMCFGGSTLTSIAHGLMMGYLRRSTSFLSYVLGVLSVMWLPQSLIDSLYSNSIFNSVVFLIDAFLRVHCVTSWGVDTAVRNNGSVVSACFASIATGCGGGILTALFLDATPSDAWMDKVTRVIVAKKKEMEHLLTMSLCYQAAIGFLPLPFITPLDPLTAKLICFIVFFLFDGMERMMGVRLFVPLPLTESYQKEKRD